MKTVAAIAGATADFSNGVLVGEIDPQTRWGLGSLVANILSRSALPLTVFLTTGAQGHLTLKAIEALDPLPVDSANTVLSIERGPGTGKSRPISVITPTGVVIDPSTLSIGGSPADLNDPVNALMASLGLSPVPALSLLGILNKFEPFLDERAPGWLLVIDQETEAIHFLEGAEATNVLATLNAAPDAVAAFDLTIDPTTETVPGFGWE